MCHEYSTQLAALFSHPFTSPMFLFFTVERAFKIQWELRIYSAMDFQRPENWPELVEKAETVGHFQGISRAVFLDDIITMPRLIVFEYDARDVARKYPAIGRDVTSFFIHYYKELEVKMRQKDKEKHLYSTLILNTAMKIRELYDMLDY